MIETLRRVYRHVAPDAFQTAVLARRRAAVWRARGVVFVHVPRTGGTSINHALYGRFIGHVPMRQILRWGPSDLAALPSFAVARDPWSRLVSAYRFARRGSGLGENGTAAISQPERYRIPEFGTFERFVREWLAHQNLTKIDCVFRPQWSYVFNDEGQLLVDHLGRIEDLRETLLFLSESAGITTEFIPTNLSGPRLDHRKMYDGDLARLVGTIYRDDVEALGYRFEPSAS